MGGRWAIRLPPAGSVGVGVLHPPLTLMTEPCWLDVTESECCIVGWLMGVNAGMAMLVSLFGESPVTTTEGARTRRGLKMAEIWSLESLPIVRESFLDPGIEFSNHHTISFVTSFLLLSAAVHTATEFDRQTPVEIEWLMHFGVVVLRTLVQLSGILVRFKLCVAVATHKSWLCLYVPDFMIHCTSWPLRTLKLSTIKSTMGLGKLNVKLRLTNIKF